MYNQKIKIDNNDIVSKSSNNTEKTKFLFDIISDLYITKKCRICKNN